MPPSTPTAANPFPGDETPDLEAILLEIKKGCPSHEKRLREACELQDWYDGESEKFIPAKPAEDALSWLTKPKRISFITRQAVRKLTSHLYKPGPRLRKIGADDRVDQWYRRVVQDLQLNSLLQQCDRLAHLHGMCMLGIYPTGNPNRPINYHLFPRQDFCYWTSPDDPRVATAVCTITKMGEDLVRYRLWTKAAYYTFWKGKSWGYQPGGWNVAKYDPAASGPHPYGVLPFAFVTHELPTTELETRGVGYLLAKVNRAYNADKSSLAHWVHHYARPLGFVSGVGPEWRPKFVEGGFVPLVTRRDSTEDAPVMPEARYLESHLDVPAIQQYIMSEANQSLAEIGLPLTMQVSGTGSVFATKASGVAIAAEDADLITYAKGRQPIFEVHEQTLAGLICTIGASEPARQGALAAKLKVVGKDPSLRLSWSEPRIDLPGDDRDKANQFEIEVGITDPIEILMQRQGMSEPEAIDHYRGVARRRALVARIDAEMSAEVGAAPDSESAVPPEDKDLDSTTAEGTFDGVAPDMGVEGGRMPNVPVDQGPSLTSNIAYRPDTPLPTMPFFGGSTES